MTPQILRVFVSSTWLDLKDERAAVARLLDRFRETKYVGMEHFGSREETTRDVSLAEVDRSDVYIGIIGGRYGSGITEAEYDRARERKLPCLLYIKEATAVPPEGRDAARSKAERLRRFTKKVQDPRRGHTATQFAGCQELASLVASDLHNWLFDHYLAPALQEQAGGRLASEESEALSSDLAQLTRLNRELLTQLAAEKRRLDEQRRIALEAFYGLTYVAPAALEAFPGTAPQRERLVRDNLRQLERLYQLNQQSDVLRELATNHRLLAGILYERGELHEAYTTYLESGSYCDALIQLQPGEALYHRDRAVSYLNAGSMLQLLGDQSAARAEYLRALPSAQRAVELAPDWAEGAGTLAAVTTNLEQTASA